MAEKNEFTVWIIGTNEALKSGLEKTGNTSVRVVSSREVLEPLRFAVLPQLIVISKPWSSEPALLAFLKSCGTVPLWLDLVHQTEDTLEAFRVYCQSKGIEGGTFEISPLQLDWVLALVEGVRLGQGSVLNSVATRGGASPVVYASRVVSPAEIGARIDFLAQKNSNSPPLQWYTLISSLASLSLEIAREVGPGGAPVLPMYAAEVPGRNWVVAFQLPVARKHVPRLGGIIAKLRSDVGVRSSLAFNFVTRESGGLFVTYNENLIELAVVFSPTGLLGRTVFDAGKSYREAMVIRLASLSQSFNPSACLYSTFPEQSSRIESRFDEIGRIDEGTEPRSSKSFDKAQKKLAKIEIAGNDESFAAFLKGIDAADGGTQTRFGKLIETLEKTGGAEQGELIKDLLKRYFMLVDELKRSKQRAA